MDQKIKKHIEVVNRKAEHLYFLDTRFEAGMVLKGTEIKSIRMGSVNMGDAFCYLLKGELYVKSLHISPYKFTAHDNHDPMRIRKLLLKKHELRKIAKKVKEKGYTIVPTRLFINERGYAKLEVALAKGKKSFDKRDSIKKKDVKRDIERSRTNRW